MKATNLAFALLFASAVSAASTAPAAPASSGFMSSLSSGLSSMGSTLGSGLSAASKKVQTATTQAVTKAGYNRVDLKFKFTCSPPLGSYLTPQPCPATVNALTELFTVPATADPKGYSAPSNLYCSAALTSLAALEPIDVLLEAVKGPAEDSKAKIKHALLSLMYKYIRLHGHYKPRHIQQHFNNCMEALKKVTVSCEAAECSVNDLGKLKDSLFAEASPIKACLDIPTMKTQITDFIDKLKEALPGATLAENVHSLKKPEGIASAFSKAASSSSFMVSPLLLDSNYVAARKRVVLILDDFKKIRPDLYQEAEAQFIADNGAAIEFENGEASVHVSRVKEADISEAEKPAPPVAAVPPAAPATPVELTATPTEK